MKGPVRLWVENYPRNANGVSLASRRVSRLSLDVGIPLTGIGVVATFLTAGWGATVIILGSVILGVGIAAAAVSAYVDKTIADVQRDQARVNAQPVNNPVENDLMQSVLKLINSPRPSPGVKNQNTSSNVETNVTFADMKQVMQTNPELSGEIINYLTEDPSTTPKMIIELMTIANDKSFAAKTGMNTEEQMKILEKLMKASDRAVAYLQAGPPFTRAAQAHQPKTSAGVQVIPHVSPPEPNATTAPAAKQSNKP